MKAFCLLNFFIVLAAAWAQAPAPKPPAARKLEPDTVIATYGDGKKLTYGELKTLMSVLPPQMQQGAQRDPKGFVQQFALLSRLAEMAEQEKLDQRSPTKESLRFNRMYVMATAQLNEAMNLVLVQEPEIKKFYAENHERYVQVQVQAIYVAFKPRASKSEGSGGKNERTEQEAQAKIEKLRQQIVAGADFAKLAKEQSDDQSSASKDGDFGTFRRNDNMPEAIRAAVFALKQGEVSEPVRQPNGFYLFRAKEVGVRPFKEVRDEIHEQLKQAGFKKWMEETNRSLNVKFENEEFFHMPAIHAPAAPAPAGK